MTQRLPDDERVMSLVERALACPPEQRAAFLEQECGGDSTLREEVQSCVEWEIRMGGFLKEPLVAFAAPESAAHPFEPGELLDRRFRIVRELAQGGMGIVYEAHDERLDRRIALKCAKLEFRRQLPREVRSATEVSHPNVCKLYEIHTAVTRHGEIDFLTMEFLNGETLSDRLQRAPMDEATAREIARQICAGLAEAHRMGVIHGDLKCNNVILVPASGGGKVRAVITDFGLAHRADAAPGTPFAGERGGTRGYMAPEVIRGEKLTVASDIYALGVILSELAFSAKPAKARSPRKSQQTTVTITLAAAVPTLARTEPTAAASVNPRWDSVLAGCLDADPSKRFPSVEQVARALEPSRTMRTVLGGMAVAALAVLSAIIAYQSATGPKTKVRLALLPFDAPAAPNLIRDTEKQLSPLKGDANTAFRLVAEPGGATHTLSVALRPAGADYQLEAHVRNLKTGTDAKVWMATYHPGELRFLPDALTGLVTGTLEIPPATAPTVSAPAKADLDAAVAALQRLSGTAKALDLMKQAVIQDPESAWVWAELAEAQYFTYFITKDRSWLRQASESARNAEIRNPDLAPVRRISGLLKYVAGQYPQAASDYRRAIALEPGNGDGYRRLGMALEAEGLFDEAREALRRAIRTAPKDYRNHQQLGALEDHRYNLEAAAVEFAKAAELAPDESEPHRVLGDELHGLGRMDEAEKELRASMAIKETPAAMNSLAIVLMCRERNTEALPYLRRAIQIGGKGYLWLLNLSIAAKRAGLPKEAEDALEQAIVSAETQLTRSPRNTDARAALAYLAARHGDRNRALTELAQALQPGNPSADTQYFAVHAYEALGNRDDTIALLRSAAPNLLFQLNRWPELADLARDPRFIQLLQAEQNKKAKERN